MPTKTGRQEKVYDYLREIIMSNKIKPGDPLREMEIAHELSMSRTPVREAFRRLEAEGLITSFPSCGTIVRIITPTDAEEVYELRVLFETWSLGKSIHRITDAELDEVEQAFVASQQDPDPEAWHQADRALHDLIIRKSGNRHFIDTYSSLLTMIERIRLLSSLDETRRESSFKEHMQIIHLIRKRDLDRAVQELTRHLSHVAESAIEAVKISRSL